MELLVLSLLNGISWGVILFLFASGLSLVLGVVGILNMAHGALYMVGAYIGWTLAVKYGLNFGLGVLAAGLTAGLLGFAMERGFLRHLYKRLDDQVLLTVGFIYIVTNLILWIWGGWSHAPFTAGFLSGSFNIMTWSYPVARVAIILIGVALSIGLWWLQDKTRVGSIIRAGMDDKEMATGLGINLGLIVMAIFFLGSFIAGAAGVIGAYLLGVNLTLGFNVLLFGLIVIAVGGVGSMQGALLGGILIGVVDSFGKALLPDLGMFFIYLIMVIVLAVRPIGILGRKR